jgi:hypothetical protein
MNSKSIFKSKIFWAQMSIIAGAVFTFFTTPDPTVKAACISAIVIAIGTIIMRITSKPTKLTL